MKTTAPTGIRPEYWSLLTDAPYPRRGNPFWRLVWIARAPLLWVQHREAVLADWVKERPGTRPNSWWQFEMPLRQRDQLGGQGSCRQMYLWCGIPRQWFNVSHGNPPVFESQASFLKRNQLLWSEEEARLQPSDFLPQILPKAWWPVEDV